MDPVDKFFLWDAIGAGAEYLSKDAIFRQPSQLAQHQRLEAKQKARNAMSEVVLLRAQVERLSLATAALWTLLRERTDFTDDELVDRVRELDLADGKRDGRMAHTLKECPQCSRKVSSRHPYCLYCEHDLRTHGLEGPDA